jgi:hypothetical protein
MPRRYPEPAVATRVLLLGAPHEHDGHGGRPPERDALDPTREPLGRTRKG